MLFTSVRSSDQRCQRKMVLFHVLFLLSSLVLEKKRLLNRILMAGTSVTILAYIASKNR